MRTVAALVVLDKVVSCSGTRHSKYGKCYCVFLLFSKAKFYSEVNVRLYF